MRGKVYLPDGGTTKPGVGLKVANQRQGGQTMSENRERDNRMNQNQSQGTQKHYSKDDLKALPDYKYERRQAAAPDNNPRTLTK